MVGGDLNTSQSSSHLSEDRHSDSSSIADGTRGLYETNTREGYYDQFLSPSHLPFGPRQQRQLSPAGNSYSSLVSTDSSSSSVTLSPG